MRVKQPRRNLKKMTQKKRTMLLMLMTVSLLLVGCRKALEPEEAGVLFVNRLIYEAKDKRFEKNFVDGLNLELEMKQQRETLTKDLITSFNEFGGVISAKQTEKFLTTWLDKMNSDTYYQVKSVKRNKKEKTETITFEVGGLDFQQVYKVTMDKLVDRMLEDSNLLKNNVKLGDLTIQLLTESMEEAEPIKKTIPVTLTIKKVKKKWQVSEKAEEEEIAKILLAFMVGSNTLDDYASEMGEAVSKAVDEALKNLEDEYSGEKKADDKKAEKEKAEEQAKSAEEKKADAEKKKKEDQKKAQTSETVETVETYEDESEDK